MTPQRRDRPDPTCRLSLPDLEVDLLARGATISSIRVRLDTGDWREVVLGYETIGQYESDRAATGVTVGRYANRIRGGRFRLDGEEFQLARNEGANHLHGGPDGLQRRIWRLERIDEQAWFHIDSADGDQGYPGNLSVSVGFSLASGRALRIHYRAVTDRSTVINLTNHSYFNLDGEDAVDVLDHRLQIASDAILEVDAESIPTGNRIDVRGTPFDFREATRIGARIEDAHPQLALAGGYDHCFVLVTIDSPQAQLTSASGDLTLVMETDQPGVQIYTDNHLGRRAVCLETQHFPDSPNQPSFPSTRLDAGTMFESVTEYRFEV